MLQHKRLTAYQNTFLDAINSGLDEIENNDNSDNLLGGKLEHCVSKSPYLRTSVGNKLTKERKDQVHSASPSMRYRLNTDISEPETDLLLSAAPDENMNSRSITSETSLLSRSSGQRTPFYPTRMDSSTGNSENSTSSLRVSPTALESTTDEQDTERENGKKNIRSRRCSIRSMPESDQTSDISHIYRNHHFPFGQPLGSSVGVRQVQNNSDSVVVTFSETVGDESSIDQPKTNFFGRSLRNGLKTLLNKCAHAVQNVLSLIHVVGSRSRDDSKKPKIPSDSSKSFKKGFRQLKRLSGENVPEYKMLQFTKPNSVLLHYGMFRIVWDWIVLLSTSYIAFAIPYSVSFGWQNGWVNNYKRAIDLIIEMLLILDVVFNFNTTYVNSTGQLVYNRRDLARHYARTWLLIDILAALPVDSVHLAVQVLSCSAKQYTIPLKQERWSRVDNGTVMNSSLIAHPTTGERSIYSLFQMMKLARLLRLARLFQNLARPSQHSIIALGLLMFSFALLAHWFACIWYVIGVQETENVEAALMHAAIFGNVTAIIRRFYVKRTAFQAKTQELKDFFRVHSIPKQLKRRMEDFFQTMWAINRGINTSEVLSIYPEELRRDIALHLSREVLCLKVFDSASQDCLRRLALHIKTSFFTPGEYLIHAGDMLGRIYFVCSGSLKILENDEVVALAGKNDWFGTYINAPVDCVHTIHSRCVVKSMTYCELQSIDLSALNQVLEQYPAFKAEFTDYLYEDLSFNIQDVEKYVDKDAIMVPARTLQLAQDNSPTSQDCFNTERCLSGVEYDGMETNSCCSGGDIGCGPFQCGEQNSHATFTTKSRTKSSRHKFSESSVSSSDEMRYYPRRPSRVDKHQSKRRFRGATLGSAFNHQGEDRTEPSKNLLKTSEDLPNVRRKSYSSGTNFIFNDYSTIFEPNSIPRTAMPVTELTITGAIEEDTTHLHLIKTGSAPPPPSSKTETSDQFQNFPKDASVGSSNRWNIGISEHVISHEGPVQLRLKFSVKPLMSVVTPASSTLTPSIEDTKPVKQFTGNTLTVPGLSEAKRVSRSTLSLPLQPKIAAPSSEQYAQDTCRSQVNLGPLNIDQAKSFNPCSNDVINRITYQNQSLSNEVMRLHDRMGNLENQIAEILSIMKPNGAITR